MAMEYNRERRWFQTNQQDLRQCFGDALFQGDNTDWGQVRSAITWCDRLLRHFGEAVPTALAARFNDVGQLQRESRQAVLNLELSILRATELVEGLANVLPPSGIDGSPLNEVFLGRLTEWLSARIEQIHRLQEWTQFLDAKGECSQLGLDDFVQQIIDQGISATHLRDVFRKRLLTAWLAEASKESPAIGKFNGLYRGELIRSYRELDRALIRKAAQLVLAKVEQGQPRPVASTGAVTSQMSILLREIQKKSRHKPLRTLFSEIPELLQRLKPCLLMSPLSVSSYLASERLRFDVVIFDEASQIPPWDAICSILRADQVIVAGDNKQLPPTWFFQVDLDEDEEETEEDLTPLESILDECAALPGFSQCHLRWHYRSRNEGLIAFSNQEFYQGRLITFPSPVTEDKSVLFDHVPGGVYDRGGSRTNRIEAQRVAALVFDHFERYGTSRSLGVIAMSVAQERAIDEEIQRLRPNHPHLEPCFSEDVEEPFFVKNLENVQGDERDHIILSVGYGRDRAGVVSLNFGPINRTGGERRLNVAITRARFQTMVVCSFLPHELDLTKLTTNNPGITLLQRYLEYARSGRFPTTTTAGESTESDFEEAVLRALQAAGFQVDVQVGCSGFRIDLAIRHPRQPGRYILGIECDGKTYHEARSARDRDRLRQEVLEGLGWRILRIWSPDWLSNPQAQVERVRREVERLIDEDENGVPAPVPSQGPKQPPSNENEKADEDDPPPTPNELLTEPMAAAIELVPYRAYAPQQRWPARTYYEANGWSSSNAMRRLVSELTTIVDVEAPIHRDAALRRLASLLNISRVGARVRSIGLAAIREATRSGNIVERGDFLYGKDAKPVLPRRRPDSTWPFHEIPLEELCEAMRLLLSEHVGMSELDLMRETARLFGYERMGSRVEAHLREAVGHLIQSGDVRRTEGVLTLS